MKALFGSIGPLQTCKVIKDKGTGHSLGYAFVNYVTSKDAEDAISALNGTKVQNKTIKVSYARPSSSSIMNANLYIAYLPSNYTRADLEGLFKLYGAIITSKILEDPETKVSKGVGFIRFDKRSEAEKAISALNGKHLPGSPQPLLVKFANQSKSGGSSSVPVQQGGMNNGIVTITRRANPVFNSSGAGGPMRHNLGSSFRFNPVSINPISLNPGLSVMNPLATPTATPGQGYCLFVFNIPESSDEDLLFHLFASFGAILNVKIMRDQTGKCKGFGFVNMATYESAYQACCAMNGYMLDGKQLQVSFKRDKK